MRIGASFRVAMSGSYWLLEAPTDERSMALSLTAQTPDLRETIRGPRAQTWRATGNVDAERLASGRPLEGAIVFELLDARRVVCRFAFAGDDARRYEISGVAEFSRFSPLASLTRLPCTLYDGLGEEVARAELRFDLRRDALRSVKSFRLACRP